MPIVWVDFSDCGGRRARLCERLTTAALVARAIVVVFGDYQAGTLASD